MGFRFTIKDIANKLGVMGWVKNLRDGRVEVVAEAEEKALEEFLASVKEYFSKYISDTDLQWKAATGKFNEFQINF